MTKTLEIVMMIPGMEIVPNCLKTKSLGGSETAGLSMATALQKRGHRVTVFCSCRDSFMEEGVTVVPLTHWNEYAQNCPHDISIVQRTPEALGMQLNSRLNILWQHDLAVGRVAGQHRGCEWNIDKIFLLSEFHKQQYQEVMDDGGDYYVTRNGLDLSLFDWGYDERERAPNAKMTNPLLIYAARPERGLDVLLQDVMPKVWEKKPNVYIGICTYEHQHPSMQTFYQEIGMMIARANQGSLNGGPPRVQMLGHLPKPELYKAYRKSTLYIYPTPGKMLQNFREISCISAMEAMACGLPFVSSKLGALPETLHPDAGSLIEGDSSSPEYHQRFADEVIRLLDNPLVRRSMSEAGKRHAKTLSWDLVAEDWEEKFWTWLDERNSSKERLVRHLINFSDIIPARSVIETMDESPIRDDFKKTLDEGQWGFVKSEEYTRQYDKIVHDLSIFENVKHEVRLQWLLNELRQKKDVLNILDFGCAHGSYQVHIANALGEHENPRQWTGVDIAQHSIDCGNELKKTKAKFPDRHEFVTGNEDVNLDQQIEQFGKFDGLIAFEVLEHVPRPWETLEKLEKWLEKDSWVFITVPSGPWEAMSFDTYPHRCHIWHYDSHDLRDMLGHKPSFEIIYMSGGRATHDLSPLGWWIVKYQVGTECPRPIDLERHVRLQRPRETLSAVIMAGGNSEETLHWCLRPLKRLADELIIVDNGMNSEISRILEKYPVKIVPGVDPTKEGFETPRNIGVQAARMDWILWIDSDERLLNSEAVSKYLRRNSMEGYGVKQHHFSVDSQFKPDLPVRFFRNNGHRYDQKEIKFFGMIHEHPETGINDGPGRSMVLSDIAIAHVGYLTENIRRLRFQRNNPLLKKDREKYPNRILGHHFEMRDNMLWVQFLLEQGHGRITQEVRDLCEATVKLFQSEFLGKPYFLQNDTLQYYSLALGILNRGFEYSYITASLKDGVGGREEVKGRFASVEDLKKILDVEADKQKLMTSPYW